MKPTLENVRYGPHERNVLDVYRVESRGPSPVFLWIHGGGFRAGDKSERVPSLLPLLSSIGASLVTTNYRLSQQAIYPAPYHDCRRALQYVRHHAASWGLDGDRIGVGGGSAGAGMSQWLAFRSDMADPESDDPVARESTRVSCVYTSDGQTSYDPRFIEKLIGGKAHLVSPLPQLFGVPEEVWPELDSRADVLVTDAAPVNFLSEAAPPVLCAYSLPLDHEPDIHHPRFGVDLKERMDALGVPCTLLVAESTDAEAQARWRSDLDAQLGAFLKRHLVED